MRATSARIERRHMDVAASRESRCRLRQYNFKGVNASNRWSNSPLIKTHSLAPLVARALVRHVHSRECDALKF